MKTPHIPMCYRQIFNHFNFLCFIIRQGSQYQRNNKVIKKLQRKKSILL